MEDFRKWKVPPILYCSCGEPLGLYNHSIDDHGVVSPSVYHYESHENRCGWHFNIKLLGYKDHYFKGFVNGK